MSKPNEAALLKISNDMSARAAGQNPELQTQTLITDTQRMLAVTVPGPVNFERPLEINGAKLTSLQPQIENDRFISDK